MSEFVWSVTEVGMSGRDAWDYGIETWLFTTKEKALIKLKALMDDALEEPRNDYENPADHERIKRKALKAYNKLVISGPEDERERIFLWNTDYCDSIIHELLITRAEVN